MQHNPNQGYLATSEYIYAYFRQQHPASLRWVLLLAGFKTPSASADALHCELGFGQGLGLAITAAATSERQVGVDFMPEQVDNLTQLLNASGVSAELACADFAQFLATNQQTFQTISLHGVWSWVAPEIRQQILSIIERFLSDDGVVYLSHNTLPGCAPILPMQRLIHHTAQSFSDHEDDGLQAALAVLQSAMPLSRYVESEPSLLDWWQSLAQENPRYLSHEYLGHAWHPMSFHDTADGLAQAGLSFTCSADAIELLTDCHFTAEQQAWLNDLPEGRLRESYADVLRNQTFRRDIWQKHPQRLTPEEQTQALLSTKLVLLHPLSAIMLQIQGDLGRFDLPQPITAQCLQWLASNEYAAKSVTSLLVELNQLNPQQPMTVLELIPLLAALTAIGAIHPANVQITEELTQRSLGLNRQLMQYAWQDNRIAYLASPVAGCGVQVSRLQQLGLLAYEATQAVDADCWAQWLWQGKDRLVSNVFSKDLGKHEQLAWLSSQFAYFIEHRFKLLQALRVIH
jgi:hypothetical protein